MKLLRGSELVEVGRNIKTAVGKINNIKVYPKIKKGYTFLLCKIF